MAMTGNRGGKRQGSGRKNYGLKKNTVYVAVAREVKNEIRRLAKKKEMSIKDYIKELIENVAQ